ncbi:MAG: hypothetical protein QOF76_1260 [Solirubrobacteraceae bacterium]|jgi:hypothetical protein|nr:hypothetical protein [Solirubrobacteraceae bacterium]
MAPAFERLADSLQPQTLLAEVQRAWRPDVVGERVAAAGSPHSERAGVVTIRCGEAVWAQELDLLSGPISEALNTALGRPAVKGLRTDARPVVR